MQEILEIARRHVGKGVMVSSAKLCLADAEKLLAAGDVVHAKDRALKAIAYSVGMMHRDYIAAARI